MLQISQENQYCCYRCARKSMNSRKEEGSSRRKRLKTKHYEPPDFSFLPQLVLVKIFSYLEVEDRCRAAHACRNWYQISKSSCLWRHVSLLDMTPRKMTHVYPALSPSTEYLHMSSLKENHIVPMWLPEVLKEIHHQSPYLKTLIFEGANLMKNVCCKCSDAILMAFLETLHEELFHNLGMRTRHSARKLEHHCLKNTKIAYNLLQHLEVLSLRKTIFNSFLFFSRIDKSTLCSIRVLDMTCALRSYARHLCLFSRVEFLEELYLPGSILTDSDTEVILKSAVRLKVLDVEHTDIGPDGFQSILKHGHCLEKLFLANTKFTGFELTKIEGVVLQRLHTLCIRTTPIVQAQVEALLLSFRSLERVDVTFTGVSVYGFSNLTRAMQKKLVFEQDAEYLPFCDHFYMSAHLA